MKKINKKNENEIQLIDLISLLFNNKLMFIIFISISIIIGVLYNYNSQNLYKFTLKIKPINNSALINYTTTNEFIKTNKLAGHEQYLVTNSSVFEKFVEELLDYQELISVLKKFSNTEEQVSTSSINSQNFELASIAKSFTVEPVYSKFFGENSNSYLNLQIKFVWQDKDEGIKILDETLNAVLENLKFSINNDLENYIRNIYNNKIQKDTFRIDHLTEQSLIVKELGIKENSAKQLMGLPEYMRGYRALDKEISLIKDRKYRTLNNLFLEVDELKNLIKIN